MISYHDIMSWYHITINRFFPIIYILHFSSYTLKNDFNTPDAVNKLYNLVKVINIYVKNEYKITIVRNAINLIKDYFNVFGITINNNSSNKESDILDSLCKFRDNVRKYAFNNKQYEILKITDEVRDVDMPKINITLEDKSKTESIWRYSNI